MADWRLSLVVISLTACGGGERIVCLPIEQRSDPVNQQTWSTTTTWLYDAEDRLVSRAVAGGPEPEVVTWAYGEHEPWTDITRDDGDDGTIDATVSGRVEGDRVVEWLKYGDDTELDWRETLTFEGDLHTRSLYTAADGTLQREDTWDRLDDRHHHSLSRWGLDTATPWREETWSETDSRERLILADSTSGYDGEEPTSRNHYEQRWDGGDLVEMAWDYDSDGTLDHRMTGVWDHGDGTTVVWSTDQDGDDVIDRTTTETRNRWDYVLTMLSEANGLVWHQSTTYDCVVDRRPIPWRGPEER
jgi:hypothetical protein